MFNLCLAVLSAYLITFFVIPSIVNVSKAKKLFDEPNQRRLNKVVVPTMGGIAIFIGFAISSMLFLEKGSPHELRYLSVAIMMMFFIGIKDDILVIAPAKKMIVQLAAALILVIPGKFCILHTYGLFPAEVLHPVASIPLSVLMILLLINAFNLIDGIDGLAGGLAFLASAILGTWFFLTGHLNSAIMCAALCGTLPAFLYYNLAGGRNKIFMGDTGSLILGIFLAAMVIRFSELNYTAGSPFRVEQAPLFALALMIVPVTDTLRVFFIRIKAGRPPFSPDMNHIHHLLIRSGLSHIQATCLLLTYTVFFILLALLAIGFNLKLSFTFPLLLTLSFGAAGLISYRAARVREAGTGGRIKRYEVKTIPLHVLKNEPAAGGKMTAETGKPSTASAAGHLIKINASLPRNLKVHAGD